MRHLVVFEIDIPDNVHEPMDLIVDNLHNGFLKHCPYAYNDVYVLTEDSPDYQIIRKPYYEAIDDQEFPKDE